MNYVYIMKVIDFKKIKHKREIKCYGDKSNKKVESIYKEVSEVDRRKLTCIIMSAIMLTSTVGSVTVSAQTETRTVASSVTKSTDITISSIPANYKSSIEWVWNNRIVKEGSTKRKNLIFDQIYAGNGTLNYVVRWQSNKSVTLQQRKNIAKLISNQINNWNKHLKGYDGWPYDEIKVNVVGWACADASLILDKQSDEKVYTDYIHDDLSNSNSSIPSKLPVAPSELSRFDHFQDANYSYPGGLDKRFDMYLWCTSNFGGGAGGDWGQRMSDDYILNSDPDPNVENYVLEHEIGHGFGITDFYKEEERPPGGFPTRTIMWALNSPTITDWDVWMLRYIWTQLKKDTTRFPERSVQDSTTNKTETGTTGKEDETTTGTTGKEDETTIGTTDKEDETEDDESIVGIIKRIIQKIGELKDQVNELFKEANK